MLEMVKTGYRHLYSSLACYEQLLILQGEVERNKDSTPGYWPLQQGERRSQQTSMYQAKAISANCVNRQKSERARKSIFGVRKKKTKLEANQQQTVL